MARASAGQSVLSRVVRVLEAFEQERPVLSVAQLARRAGLPVATAHRIVGELLGMGMLERNEDGRIRVGVRLWEIASSAPGALGLREAAMPFMHDVHAVTRHHVQLGVLEGNEALFIERLSARNATITMTRVGGRLPVHASSVGLVLLAHAGDKAQEEVLGLPLESLTSNTPTDPRQLRAILADARLRGYAICAGYLHPDSMGVAVPVLGRERVVAGLGVIVPSNTAEPRALVPVLAAASRGITRRLLTGRVAVE